MRAIVHVVIVLGYVQIPLLALAVYGLDTAMIDVVLVENNAGQYTTLTYHVKGRFSRAGAITSAEGDILQLQGQKLCSKSLNMRTNHEYGWVGVMKLPPTDFMRESCVSIVKKAEIAVQRGATAVIFDVTDNPGAREELEAKAGAVLRPVVIVEGKSAKRLESLLHKRKLSRARIKNEVKKITQETSNEYFDMGIFMAFFILVSLICLVLLIKIKWRQKRKQTSLTRMALQAISRMETRKFTSSSLRNASCSGSRQSLNTVYSCNRWPYYDIRSCAICLEEFIEGQDIRIVPCRHEFHKSCVDPWLLSNCTCPLCMLNIVEPWNKKKRPRDVRGGRRRGLLQSCCLPNCCLVQDADAREADTEETFTQIPLSASIDNDDVYHDESQCAFSHDPNLAAEQITIQSSVHLDHAHMSSISSRDCLQPYRFHKCKFHQKKSRQRTMNPSPSGNLGSDIEHSIVVVANLPVDNFEKLQEDVV